MTNLPERPTGRLRVVIDTDAANEIDDQFAIAWALLAPDLLDVAGIHSAPFCHGHYFQRLIEAAMSRGGGRTPMEDLASLFTADQHREMVEQNSPVMGEERSRAEIHRVVAAMDLVSTWSGSSRHRHRLRACIPPPLSARISRRRDARLLAPRQ